MKIVLLGAPGSGKGTQAPYIKEKYGVCHLSTGDLLREAVGNKTENGLKAKEKMDAGALVSDEIVFDILKDGMKKPDCRSGYIIDGLPRTLGQAEAMQQKGITVEKTIHFQVPDDVIIERTSGRWIHKASGRSYHEVFAPPKTPGIDDITGEPLMQRADDKKEVAVKRLATYHKEVDPIAAFYKKMGTYASIDGNRPMLDVRNSINAALSSLAAAEKPWYQFW